MRVQDLRSIGDQLTTMAKKKHKLKIIDQLKKSDSSDDNSNSYIEGQCNHLKKSINLNNVKTAIKGVAIGKCLGCASSSKRSAKPVDSASVASVDSNETNANRSEASSLADECESSIFLCLQCGNQGCDRYSPDKHALQHFKASQSGSHDLVLNISTWEVWCYGCDGYITAEKSKKLRECVELIRKQDSSSSGAKRMDSVPKENGAAFDENGVKEVKNRQKLPSTSSSSGMMISFPKVKGLNNLGNTCFFNAVMQNLSQTQLLESQIRDYTAKALTTELTACPQDLEANNSDDDHTDDEKPRKMERIVLNLAECGGLTQSMLGFFDDMKMQNSKQNSVNPNNLFGQVCKKAPRFKGFQQQDSHELLRYLLDAIRAEEIKRLQSAILKHFNIPDNPKTKDIAEEDRIKVKAFGRQAKHTFIDSIFGGYFISTVTCQACDTPHQIYEPFLDISVPVIEEKVSFSSSAKASHSAAGKKKSGAPEEQPEAADDDIDFKYKPTSGSSKHMNKKECKAARKNRNSKGNKGKQKITNGVSNSIEESVQQENSDGGEKADVEKNEGVEELIAKTEQLVIDGGCLTAENRIELVGEEKMLDVEKKDAGKEDDRGESDLRIDEENPHPTGQESPSAVDRRSASAVDRRSPSGVDRRSPSAIDQRSPSGVDRRSPSAADRRSPSSIDQRSPSAADQESANDQESPTGTNNSRSSSESESSDADVEDNIESDASKYRTVASSANVGTNDRGNIDDAAALDNSLTVNGLTNDDNVNNCSSLLQDEDSSRVDGQMSSSQADEMTSSMKTMNLMSSSESTTVKCVGSHDCTTETTTPTFSPVKSDKPVQLAMTCAASKVRNELKKEAMKVATTSLCPRQKPLAQECSIISCLYQFTLQELLSGDNMYCCKVCNKRSNKSVNGQKQSVYKIASKQILIYSPPAVLTLHLKRFQQVGFNFRKVTQHVEFSELLDMAPYCSTLCQNVKPGQQKVLYSLFGVVEHSGTLRSGHYTAYVKVRQGNPGAKQFLQKLSGSQLSVSKLVESFKLLKEQTSDGIEDDSDLQKAQGKDLIPPGKWFYISDTNVNEVRNVANVFSCQAYLLFYERIY